MPTSPYSHMETFVAFLMQFRPRSMLDIGLGNGKWGFLARDCLDVMLNESYHRSRWQVRIDGIEAYADYIQDHQRAIYDTIHIGDAFDVIDHLGTYDLVVLGDVLEHFEKDPCPGALRQVCRSCAATRGGVHPPGQHMEASRRFTATRSRPIDRPGSSTNSTASRNRHALFDYRPGPYGAFFVNRDDYVDLQDRQVLSPDPMSSPNLLSRRLAIRRETVSRVDLRPLARHVADSRAPALFSRYRSSGSTTD